LLGPVLLVVSHVFLEELQSNAKFAITVEPENKRLKSRFEQVKELRQKGLATIPSTLGEEKETNPFLRPFSAGLRKTMKVPADASDIQAFAAVRAAKDRA
jgi:hydroxyacylglutathione hydrolase